MRTLYLVRHAHRDKGLGSHQDNGLSEKGRKQAQKIKDYIIRNYEEDLDSFSLISSPKKRCIETIQPISEACGIEIVNDPLVGEGGDLDFKVKQFVNWWRHQDSKHVLLSSHGDWIPVCVQALTGARIECKKGCFIEISEIGTNPYIVNIVQKPS